MKKTLITTTMVALTILSVKAQNVRFGFTAGATLSNYYMKMDGEVETADSKAGLIAGFIADIQMDKNFSIQPGLHFVQKGAQSKQTSGGYTTKITLTNNLIEVPLNFLYNTNGTSGNFFIGAGPSVGIAVSGKWKYDFNGVKTTESVNLGSDANDEMKSLDFGVNALAGYCFPNGLMLVANYNAGFNNLVPDGGADGTMKSHYFGIRLGWLLKASQSIK